MRKTSAALASLSLAAFALTGCSVGAPSSAQACERPASAGSVTASVEVDGEFGVAPDVHVYAPIGAAETSFADVIAGEGRPLTSPTQIMAFDYALYNGQTGEQIERTEFDGSQSRITNISTLGQSLPGVQPALECATPGTRVVATLSPEDTGAPFPVVVVVDVLDTQLSRATGELKFNDARGLPTVVRAADGRPGVIVPDAEAPSDLVSQVLIEGDGPVVAEGDAPWVTYSVVDWSTREMTTTTWDGNPVQGMQDVSPEVASALVGETIGSQVMVVVPGEGDAAATVYVVDILGAGSTRAQ